MIVSCPVCKNKTTWEENSWRPFCSERCKLIDLGKWALEDYRIPAEEADQEKGPKQKSPIREEDL
jgi:uncharacterized protein